MSESTVVRFAQGLGFDNYREFRQNLRHHYLGMLVPLEELRKQERSEQSGFALLRKQILQDENNLRSMLDTVHEAEIQSLIGEINRARTIVIIASGSYAAVALVFGHLLRFMGYSAIVEERGGPSLTAALMPLDKRDLVIGFSFWRVVRETHRALAWAQQRDVPTVAITDTIYSPLVKSADQSIIMPTESISFFQSMVAPLAFVYAVAAQLALDADEERERLMQDAVQSFEFFNISSKR
jgi:DNA-binding MurR/RpiR family transcriptional regulator